MEILVIISMADAIKHINIIAALYITRHDGQRAICQTQILRLIQQHQR